MYRDINEYKKHCQPRISLIKVDSGYLLACYYFEYVDELLLPAIECTQG
jgi:hypothetical protein